MPVATKDVLRVNSSTNGIFYAIKLNSKMNFKSNFPVFFQSLTAGGPLVEWDQSNFQLFWTPLWYEMGSVQVDMGAYNKEMTRWKLKSKLWLRHGLQLIHGGNNYSLISSSISWSPSLSQSFDLSFHWTFSYHWPSYQLELIPLHIITVF